MRNRFMNFMAGRYGLDDLGKFTLIAAVVVMVINMFADSTLLTIVEWALLIYTIFRMFSRDSSKRQKENETYMVQYTKVKNWFSNRKRISGNQKGKKDQSDAGQSADICIFTCPNCSQKIRVPRGKGKIQITCPNCGTSFIERS